MVVVHVITRFIRGGADENTLLCCNAQAEKGLVVHLVIGKEASDAMVSRLHSGVVLHVVESMVREINPVKDVAALFEMRSLFRKIRPDIVHTHTSKAGILGRVAARMSRGAKIVHGVHILPFLNVGRLQYLLYLMLEKLLVKSTDMYVNVSSGMQREGISHGIGAPERHVVIPSGMDVVKFRTARSYTHEEMSRELGVDFKSPPSLVLMVAALEPRKRIYEFLDAFSDVAAAHTNAIFVVLGEGHDSARIAARAAELGLCDRVFLAGFRDDVERWIASAAVCVLASEREGLPRSVVQYALGAAPCVVTNLPGVDAVVHDGVTGYLVDPAHVADMAPYINTIMTDEILVERMRGVARTLDLSAWSVDYMVSELDKVYDKVLALSPGQSA